MDSKGLGGEDVPVNRASVPSRRGGSRSPAVFPVPFLQAVPGRGPWADRTLLRFGTRPFLVGADLLAWLLAAFATGAVAGRDVVLLLFMIALYASAGLYRSRLSLSALDDLPALAGRALASAAVTTSLALLLDPALVDVGLLRTAVVLACSVVLLRAAAYAVVRQVRARGWIAHPTLVLGAGRVGAQLATSLLEHPSYGLRPVGFLDGDPYLSESERPIPLLGGQESLASIIVEFGVQDVVVAFGSAPESSIVDVIRTCDRLNVEIFFVPRMFELHSMSRDMDQIWGMPLVRLRRSAFRKASWRFKRVSDVVMSVVALTLLLPLIGLVALAVRLDGGRGVLFRQERVGLDGRSFQLLKFRSLLPVDDTESATRWNVADDRRLSTVGRILRSTSLDELPQLWNILRGDMTLVGPRPERPHFVATFTRSFPRYTARHRVPAGLTGWAQVHGLRGDTSIEDRARFDNYYIENWSLWVDIKILLRTLTAVLRRSGG